MEHKKQGNRTNTRKQVVIPAVFWWRFTKTIQTSEQSYNLRCFKWFWNPPLDNQFLWQNISIVHYLHQFPKSRHVGWFLLGTFLRDSGRSFLKPLLSCHHVGIKIYPAGWKIHRILDGYFTILPILPGKNDNFSLPVEMLVCAGGYTPEI